MPDLLPCAFPDMVLIALNKSEYAAGGIEKVEEEDEEKEKGTQKT